ncbi:hypothetical protein C8F01DRAFT_1208764 [Mycena amicta]|nr:hypothetical protein C8F01DRAFT_1208764 [Mycena amicta]
MLSSRQKRKRAQPAGSTTPVVNMSMDDLFGGSAMPPMTTYVERMSNDKKRRYQEAVPVNPPSPMKNQLRQPPISTQTAKSAFSLADESYTMELNGWMGDEGVGMLPTGSTSAKGTAPVKPSDPALHYWSENHRDDYLRILLWHDGRGAMDGDTCPECLIPDNAPLYRCEECMDPRLLCEGCSVAAHRRQPLHHVSRWNGFFFARTSLKNMGLRIQFGHGGSRCVRPIPGHEGFIVLEHNGVHEVAVDFCGCEQREDEFKQLLRGRWFPATTGRPQTCATFQCLESFHALSLQAKTTAHDFYTGLELRTNGFGLKPPNRYPAFLRMMREYRHLMLLKRRGRFGHEGCRASETGVGELAIRCPACPRPGVNLPAGWENAPPEDMCLYILFIAMDACFRLKHPALGAGWAYMVETAPYRAYLLTVTDQKEMSICSGLAALDFANTKFSRGYSATGVGMGVCARHELVLPTGVGDLQKGERYANMDYIFASMLRHLDRLLRKIISYDIVCQWWKQLKDRLLQLPPLIRLHLVLELVRFVVPKLHIHGHTLDCQTKYSLNLVPGSGQTDAEGIERAWAVVGGLAGSTRQMGPGSRSDALDDHWCFWNWRKVVGLDVAEEELVKQQEAFDHFTEEQSDSVDEWRDMVEAFEGDGSKKNPYEATMKGALFPKLQRIYMTNTSIGLTEAQVRGKLEEEEEKEEADDRRPRIHEVGPVAFIVAGLEAEDEQRRLRVQVTLKKANSTASKGRLRSLRKKLNRNIQRLRTLQATYTPVALVRLEALALAEDVLPPASTGESADSTELLVELLSIERRLREAQCRTSLVLLRNQLHIKARLLVYKQNHSRHQAMNTRSRALVARNESRIRLHSEKYQMAWNAILLMVGGVESDVGWMKLEKADIRCMQEAETLSRKEAERERKERRQRVREEKLRAEGEMPPITQNDEDEEMDVEGDEERERFTEGQNRAVISWIWRSTGSEGTDREIREALRIEWSKSWARVRRWDEEVRILKEEFRRLPVSFKYEEEGWKTRAAKVPLGSITTQEAEGMMAYALKQASMYASLRERVEITRSEEKLARGYRRRRYYPAELGFASELGAGATEEAAVDSDSEDDDERGDLDSEEELLVGGELDDD